MDLVWFGFSNYFSLIGKFAMLHTHFPTQNPAILVISISIDGSLVNLVPGVPSSTEAVVVQLKRRAPGQTFLKHDSSSPGEDRPAAAIPLLLPGESHCTHGWRHENHFTADRGQTCVLWPTGCHVAFKPTSEQSMHARQVSSNRCGLKGTGPHCYTHTHTHTHTHN